MNEMIKSFFIKSIFFFIDIMSGIPAKSVVRFKSLSKQWCSTILEDPYILQPPLQTVRTQANLGIIYILGNHIGECSIWVDMDSVNQFPSTNLSN